MLLDPAADDYRDDAALLQGIAHQDELSLEHLYARHAKPVFSLAYAIGHDAAIAEEACQDTFSQAWRNAARYDPQRGSVRTWLLMIVRSRTLDLLRTRTRHNAPLCSLEHVDEARAAQPAAPGVEDLPHAAVADVMRVLPDSDRELIDLAFFKGLTHGQIAARLDQPLGTVKARIRRVLRLLRCAIDAPACVTWADAAVAGGRPSAARPLHGREVLIMTPEADTAHLMGLVLQHAGAGVRRAASVRQAVRRMEERWPDILLTDAELPGAAAFDVLGRARTIARGLARVLPVAAFVSSSSTGIACGAAGFDLHLLKPTPASLFTARLAELVHGGLRGLPGVSA